MAADTRVTSCDPICHTTKISRIGKSVFGFAGDVMLALHVLKWLGTRRNPLDLYRLVPESHRNAVDILELAPDGLFFWNGWGTRMPILDETAAIGSGAMGALQALRLGHSPEEAVLATFPLDEASGGSVQVEHLRKAKRGRS